ncbi:hypothetical protein B4168_3305 [Anoxybacillus flavithermus]|nr:hypothetical protein B4168_3305 [Anoxybacillus flavithermus]OAO85123.1 hypothetical protein GT23_3177 [Parageobacillus thermoglucosidasius]
MNKKSLTDHKNSSTIQKKRDEFFARDGETAPIKPGSGY